MHRVEGYTVDISPKGCLAIVPQGFAVGQKMRLKNGSNQRESEAVLIWRGHEGRTGWELGVELDHPPADFWGWSFRERQRNFRIGLSGTARFAAAFVVAPDCRPQRTRRRREIEITQRR